MSEQGFRSNILKTMALALLVTAGAARAASVPVSPTITTLPDESPLVVKDGVALLSLEEAVEIALRRNLGLVIERYNRNQARLGIEQNLGIYDLLLNGTAQASDETTATVSTIDASQTAQRILDASVAQLIPLGGTVTFGFNNSRRENNSRFTSVNPSYNSLLTFSYDQPLLRNFGRIATERNLLLARNTSELSRQEFERQVVLTTQQVINAYWALVGARQQLIVAQQSLDLAKELHERNLIQVEVGTLAPLETVQSEAAIATREEGIITSQAQVGDAEDVLRRLLNLPPGAVWQAEIRPSTDPEVERVPMNLDEAIQSALATRPELKQQQLQIEQARINSAFFQNQKKPSLDLRLDYGASGIGGNVIIRDEDTGEVIDVVPGNFNDALSQATGFGFTGWTARLLFAYPLQNRGARAQSAIADLDLEQAQVGLDQLRQQVITEVRQAVRRVDTAAKSIDAARVSLEFQEKNLDAEKKRYENGMSTSFQITNIQEDVTQARSNRVNAVINYRTALAELYRVTGRLLETEGVELEDPTDTYDRWRFHLFR
jgi:outer membrane protein